MRLHRLAISITRTEVGLVFVVQMKADKPLSAITLAGMSEVLACFMRYHQCSEHGTRSTTVLTKATSVVCKRRKADLSTA